MKNLEKQQKIIQLQKQLKQIAIELKEIESEKIYMHDYIDNAFIDGYFNGSNMINHVANLLSE